MKPPQDCDEEVQDSGEFLAPSLLMSVAVTEKWLAVNLALGVTLVSRPGSGEEGLLPKREN